MESKVTIYDIAKETGFSAVTVHRALSNKGRISPKTKKLILETAKELGYKANPAAQGLHRQHIRLGAILFCPVEEYVDAIIDGIAASGAELEKYNVSVDIRKIPYTNSKDCLHEACSLIRGFGDEGYHGIILFLSSLLEETEELVALAEELDARNIPIATVANDIPGIRSVIHVGVNARMAGSMAAELLSFTCAGKDIALLVTSNTSPVNMEYISGFKEFAGEHVFSGIRIYEHYDDRDKVIETTRRMLTENPSLSGIYMTTASSALACRCIGDMEKKELTVITTDLLADTPGLLKERIACAAIFQNPFRQGKNVVRSLYYYITGTQSGGLQLISPEILLSSNVTAYLGEDAGM